MEVYKTTTHASMDIDDLDSLVDAGSRADTTPEVADDPLPLFLPDLWRAERDPDLEEAAVVEELSAAPPRLLRCCCRHSISASRSYTQHYTRFNKKLVLSCVPTPQNDRVGLRVKR